MSRDDLTTTSYAILGLLAIRPWTTYELAQQMERSLRYFWPRAQSRIYEEPKRLVAEGLARARQGGTGRRASTTYSITPKGRRVLAGWLAEPGGGPVLEFEALLKVFFGEQGDRSGVLANIGAIRAWAAAQNERNVAYARSYVETGGPFPERLAYIALIGKFLTEFADLLAGWAEWAEEQALSWPDSPGPPPPPWEMLREVAGRSLPPT